MSSQKCKYDADAFCYICGEFIKFRDIKFGLKTCNFLCTAYEAYFNCPVRNQDKPWAPHVVCSNCKRSLEGWYRGEKSSMKFGIPRIWREPKDHVNDCYFCIVQPRKRRSGQNAKPIEYPNLDSSSAPIAHSLKLPVPVPPMKLSPTSSSLNSNKSVSDKEFLATPEQPKHHPITTKDFNDLVRDLNLPKSKAELLGSRLKQWNLLVNTVDF